MMDNVTPAPLEKNRGWTVTFAGMGINLALGILYTWSVISGGVPNKWGWTQSDKAWPYAIACLVFSLVMVPAGRMQDRIGPRIVATIGGLLVGLGMVVASFTTSPLGFMIGFGVMAGSGIGFGYASATPPAVKWFPPAKTGLIAGIVVSGFGLASAYAGPLTKWLIATYGLQKTMVILGIGFMCVVVLLAQLLRAPHKVMQFVKKLGEAGDLRAQTVLPVKKEHFSPTEMLRTWQFYLLWFMFACGAGAGLMVISVAMKLGAGKTVNTLEAGTIMVMTLAVGNGAGRILAGMLSDKLGRQLTLCIFFLIQAVMVILLSLSGSVAVLGSGLALSILAALVGANYGANLSLFPSATKDFYGLKNFGVNYGLVFTAWGVGGFMLSKFAGWVYDGLIVTSWKGSFNFAYYTSAALLILAAIMTFVVKPPHHHEPAPAQA
ncbi:MAG: OFA family MFS transporter, partial [Planctomycetota bacterium]